MPYCEECDEEIDDDECDTDEEGNLRCPNCNEIVDDGESDDDEEYEEDEEQLDRFIDEVE